jgi:hypothetical protein
MSAGLGSPCPGHHSLRQSSTSTALLEAPVSPTRLTSTSPKRTGPSSWRHSDPFPWKLAATRLVMLPPFPQDCWPDCRLILDSIISAQIGKAAALLSTQSIPPGLWHCSVPILVADLQVHCTPRRGSPFSVLPARRVSVSRRELAFPPGPPCHEDLRPGGQELGTAGRVPPTKESPCPEAYTLAEGVTRLNELPRWAWRPEVL